MNMIQLRNLALVLLGASNVRVLSRGEIEARKRNKPQEATDPSKVVVVPESDSELDSPGGGEPGRSPPL